MMLSRKFPSLGRVFSLSRSFSAFGNPQHLKVETKGQAIWVTLNRPTIHNAFNEDVIAELTSTFQSIRENPQNSRAVILTGEGKSFSAGADLSWMKKMAQYTYGENKTDAELLYDMFKSISDCPVPVIGRINGAALGGGSGLAAACDFSLAVKTAKFGFTEVRLGLIPAVISPFVMRKIGSGNASRYFLTGEIFAADEAQRIGLVQQAFETLEDLDASLLKILEQLYTTSPLAVKAAKSLVATVPSKQTSEETLKDYVTEQIATIRVSPEGQEGVQSFLDKRSPYWIVK
jgi:methylglutaconyl-CoA hydratase